MERAGRGGRVGGFRERGMGQFRENLEGRTCSLLERFYIDFTPMVACGVWASELASLDGYSCGLTRHLCIHLL